MSRHPDSRVVCAALDRFNEARALGFGLADCRDYAAQEARRVERHYTRTSVLVSAAETRPHDDVPFDGPGGVVVIIYDKEAPDA